MRTLNRKSRQSGSADLKARSTAFGNPDLLRRMHGTVDEVAIELVRRGAFGARELKILHDALGESRPALRQAIRDRLLHKPVGPQAAFIAALANADRQIAIHAVINGGLSDVELRQLENLLNLQHDGHLLRQLKVAVELELERRKRGGFRSRGNTLGLWRG